MRISIKKAISILLAVLLVSMVAFAAFADDDEYENESERYEDHDEDESRERDDDHDEDYDDDDDDDRDEEDDRLNMVTFFTGTTLDLTQFEGKAFLINFFTEWCPYCMEEMPDIKKAYDTYDPRYLEIILVHPWDGEDESNTQSVIERFGLEGVTTIEDPDFMLTQLVGVPGYPTSIFIGPDGYLYYALASKIDFDLISTIFDDLGVPHRGEIRTVTTVTAPSNNNTNTNTAPDATTSATP